MRFDSVNEGYLLRVGPFLNSRGLLVNQDPAASEYFIMHVGKTISSNETE